MKTDIDSLYDFTPVVPLIFKLMPFVKIILREFIIIAKSEFISSAQHIIALANILGFKDIGLTKSALKGSRIDYKTIIIPVDTAIRLMEFIK